jgi:hypothetical protein
LAHHQEPPGEQLPGALVIEKSSKCCLICAALSTPPGRAVRAALNAQYRRLYNDALSIQFARYRIGLIFGANEDEYAAEVQTILPRLRHARSADDLRRMMHEEFIGWFGGMAGPESRYDAPAGEH